MGLCYALLLLLCTICFASPLILKSPRAHQHPKYSYSHGRSLVYSYENDSLSPSMRESYDDDYTYTGTSSASKLKKLVQLSEDALRHKLRYVVAKEKAIVVDCASAAHQMSVLKDRESLIRRALSEVNNVGKPKKLARKAVAKSKYPKYCTCKLMASNANSKCYSFTYKTAHYAYGYYGYCRKRACRGKYVCVHEAGGNKKKGIICMMRKSSSRIVPKGDGKCTVKRYESIFYTPYTYNS